MSLLKIGIVESIRNDLKQVVGVAILASGDFRRNLESALSGLLTAFALTVLLYFLLQSKIAFLLVASGYMIAGSFNAGGTAAQRVIITWRLTKVLDVMMVSKLKRWNFVLGSALAACTFGFASDFFYILVISIIAGKPEIVLLAFVFAPLMSLLGTLIGMNIASRVKSYLKAYSIYGMIFFILFFIPPVFYPVANMPEALRPLVFLTPTGLGAETLRMIAGISEPVYPLWLLAGALAVWLLASVILFSKTIKWDLD
ncbi:MAG: ABC transporter permease [Acidilobaceae archaeon]